MEASLEMGIKLRNGGGGGSQVKCCCSPMCCGGGGGSGASIVRVVCNNADCSYPQWMHAKCFDVWEQTVVQYVARTASSSSSSGRGGGGGPGTTTTTAAADRQRYHQNLWTKKGYELAYKACGCLCGKGHLRKDTAAAATGGGGAVASPSKNGSGGRRGGRNNNNNNNNNKATAATANGGKSSSSSPPVKQHQQQQPSAAVMMMNHQHQQMLLRNRANSLSSTGSTASCASSSSSSGSSSPPIVPPTTTATMTMMPTQQSVAVPSSSSSSLLLMMGNGYSGSAPTTSYHHHHQQQQQQHPGVIGTQRRNRTTTISNPIGLASSSSISQNHSSSTSSPLSSGNSGLFLHRPDFSAFNALPRHKLNSFHIKMEDEGSYGNDDIRCFILSNLAMAKMSRTLCVVCTEPMAIYDRYPLVDGTFFLSPKQYSKACIPVTVEGRQQHLSAVCMSCLEGWTCWLRCRSCRTPWNGSHLILGTMYSYDVFAAVPCCPDRLRCDDCHGLVIQPDHRFQFFSQYSRDMTCPHCSSHGHHFVKPLPTIYQLYRHPLGSSSCGSSSSSPASASAIIATLHH